MRSSGAEEARRKSTDASVRQEDRKLSGTKLRTSQVEARVAVQVRSDDGYRPAASRQGGGRGEGAVSAAKEDRKLTLTDLRGNEVEVPVAVEVRVGRVAITAVFVRSASKSSVSATSWEWSRWMPLAWATACGLPSGNPKCHLSVAADPDGTADCDLRHRRRVTRSRNVTGSAESPQLAAPCPNS